MKIKNRLSLQFSAIVAAVIALAFGILYWVNSENREYDFYTRVKDRAITTAQIFLAQDNLTAEKYREVQRKYQQGLPHEIVRLFDDQDQPVFLDITDKHWQNNVIDKVRTVGNIVYRDGERQTAGVYYHDNQGDYVVLVSAVDENGIHKLHQLGMMLIVIYLITLVLTFIAGRFFANLALAPISRLIRQMKNIKASNLHERVETGNGKDEISMLAVHFNDLLARLEKAFEMQKAFVSNASHELRTPITSIIGETEVTLHQERNPSEYQASMQSVLTEAGRLKEITNSLLELAQADFEISQFPFEEIRIDELLWDIHEEWTKKQGNHDLESRFEKMPEDENDLFIPANKQLLSIAINNIIKNAFKFSNNAQVACIFRCEKMQMNISIIDKGIGITPQDIPYIFQPFYRTGNARSFTGYGIGLSLTERIISLHQGSISVESEENKGSEFCIVLPVK